MNERETVKHLRMLEDLRHKARDESNWTVFAQFTRDIAWLLGRVNIPIPDRSPDCEFCQAVTNAEELYLTPSPEIQARKEDAA